MRAFWFWRIFYPVSFAFILLSGVFITIPAGQQCGVELVRHVVSVLQPVLLRHQRMKIVILWKKI